MIAKYADVNLARREDATVLSPCLGRQPRCKRTLRIQLDEVRRDERHIRRQLARQQAEVHNVRREQPRNDTVERCAVDYCDHTLTTTEERPAKRVGSGQGSPLTFYRSVSH